MRRKFNRWTVCAAWTFAAMAIVVAGPVRGADEAKADGTGETEAAEVLTIGSAAPVLNIEHWLNEDEKKFPKVTEFEKGKTYIVEFWATWCGPCIASMPHLAELQKEYADKGVRLVSVSNEDLETVEGFLKKETPEDEKVTYGELTSAYSLTTDPDESVYNDYMRAAGQNGIPTAFIVGKTGQVEWIGHPMRMQEPLDQVLSDSWDRAAFAKEFQEAQENELALAKAMDLLRGGKTADAIALLDQRIAKATSEDSLVTLKQYKLRALMSDPAMSDQAAAMVKDMLEDAKGDPIQIYQASAILIALAQRDKPNEAVVATAVEKLQQAVKDVEDAGKPFLYDTLARMLQVQGKLDEAIAAEQEAIKRAEGPMAKRFQSFLDDLKAEAEGDSEPKDDAEADAE